jgi:hypothetical protein
MPDMYLAACVMLSFFLFYQYRYSENKKNSILYGLLFSFSLFLGFCSKGTIVLIAPWIIYLLISDIKKHKDFSFWISVFVSGFCFLAFYFISIYNITGEASQRFDAIAANGYLNRCSYDQQSIRILIKRLFIELPSLFIRERMISSYLFIIPVFLIKISTKERPLSENKNFVINSSIILLLASNFMTISPTSYIPMCLDTRHFLFFIPIAGIAAAFSLETLFYNKRNILTFLAICSIPIAVMIFEENTSYWKLYGLIAILGTLFFFLNYKTLGWLFGLGLAAILINTNSGLLKYASDVNYKKQRETIYEEILSIKEPSYVITNEVSKRIGKYYQGFDNNHQVEFLSYNRFDPDTLKDQDIYLLENQHTRNLLFYSENDLPMYVRIKSDKDFEIFSKPELGLTLTQLDKIRDSEKSGKVLFNSMNDFESNYPLWNQDNSQIITEPKLNGEKAILCPMYSSTFLYELDSIKDSISGALFINTRIFCWTADKTKASLVISIENQDGTYEYQAAAINKYISTYSKWWRVDLNAVLSKEEIKPKSILKIYIHNPDQNSIYLDDFKVELKDL